MTLETDDQQTAQPLRAIERLLGLLETQNVAKNLPEELRDKIAKQVCEDYKNDRLSRKEWEDQIQEALRFAKQIRTPKTEPWPDCCNIIYPMLSIAANAFASRIYPEIIKDGKVIRVSVFGENPDGQLDSGAATIEAHLNYQRLTESDTWEPDLDKAMYMLAIVGTIFKKVYYDTDSNIPESDLCSPEDVVIHKSATSIKKARRITHRYFLSAGEVVCKMRNGYFLNEDMDKIPAVTTYTEKWNTDIDFVTTSIPSPKNPQYEILEMHTFSDLDDDGLEEPWILIVNPQSEKLWGVYPRFEPEQDIKVNPNTGEILCIKATQYFVEYHFYRSPDGGFYSLGYAHLLYPLNKVANSLINQLVDSGTLSNSQSGVISKNLRLPTGKINISPGRFDDANVDGMSKLSDNIFLYPFKEPSQVLFSLLKVVIEAMQQIASISDLMLGGEKPQNAPTGSVLEMTAQGLKPFAAAAKRIHRSLFKEFNLIFNLNRQHFDSTKFFMFGSKSYQIAKNAYERTDLHILPVADPDLGTDSQQIVRAMGITTILQNKELLGSVKLRNIAEYLFTALGIPGDQLDKFVQTQQEAAQAAKTQVPDPTQQEIGLKATALDMENQQKMAKIQNENTQLKLKLFEIVKKAAIAQHGADLKGLKAMADIQQKQKQTSLEAYRAKSERITADANMLTAQKQTGEDDNVDQ